MRGAEMVRRPGPLRAVRARMMTICDIYDALTASYWPYKAAISSDTALSYLERQSKEGKLDSELVDVFTKDEAPRSKLRGILRNSPKPLPSFAKDTEGSPRLHPAASYGVFGEGE